MLQKIMIIGNLGRDPEMRFTESGQAVTNMSVATNRKYTNSEGEKIERVAWFRVSVWGKQAEACNEYLAKGKQVHVEGRLITDENGNPRMWTGEDGEQHTAFEINAYAVHFLGTKPISEPPPVPEEEAPAAPETEREDDIPF